MRKISYCYDENILKNFNVHRPFQREYVYCLWSQNIICVICICICANIFHHVEKDRSKTFLLDYMHKILYRVYGFNNYSLKCLISSEIL